MRCLINILALRQRQGLGRELIFLGWSSLLQAVTQIPGEGSAPERLNTAAVLACSGMGWQLASC